tara:strand:- start:126 stop:815 length:690 start_codon:yes stop_codon:yes gene_type:complete
MSKFEANEFIISKRDGRIFPEPKNCYFDTIQAFPSTIWQLNLLEHFDRNWTEKDNQDLVDVIKEGNVSLQNASTHRTLNRFVSFILNRNILSDIAIDCGFTSLFVKSLNSQATCSNVNDPIMGIYCAGNETEVTCCISRPSFMTKMLSATIDEKMIQTTNLFNGSYVNLNMNQGSIVLFPSWLSYEMIYDDVLTQDKPIIYSFAASPSNNPREKIFADARQTWFSGMHQ